MIKLSEPHFFGKEINYLEKCINSKWISAKGKLVSNFETKIKNITNSPYTLGIINCSAALKLSIRLLEPNNKDEILAPTITFVSTINAIVENNCKPIFIDCDDKLLINLNKVMEFINKNTIFKNGFSINKKTGKKIIGLVVVHTFGNLVNLDKNFIKFCKYKNIKIIEDAAESLGSYWKNYNNKKKIQSGTIGDVGCLSFNGNKIITTGGGGMILLKSKKLYNRSKHLIFQAYKDPINFVHDDVGYNFGLSNLHAAVGLSQIKNLNKIIEKKLKTHRIYVKYINKIKGLKIIENPDYCFSNNWLNILEVDEKLYGISKKKIIEKFKKLKIETKSLWYPNHLQNKFKIYETFNIKNAQLKFKKCLCLPSSYSLSKRDQLKIISLLEKKFKYF